MQASINPAGRTELACPIAAVLRAMAASRFAAMVERRINVVTPSLIGDTDL
jgi:hypothetical protein